jgi:hypothetical protein
LILDRHSIAHVMKRSAIGSLASFIVFSVISAASVMADPAEDAVAKLSELSRQAEQTTEAMHSAQLDLNEKLAAEQAAERKLADAQAAAETAKARLATFQNAVNKVAAASYMGGHTDGLTAILTAESPQMLIEGLAVQPSLPPSRPLPCARTCSTSRVNCRSRSPSSSRSIRR